MSLETDTGSAGGEQTPIAIPTHVAGGEGNLSAREAANSVLDWRRKQAAGQTEQSEAESAEPATAEPTESVEAQAETDADPQEIEAPGETQEADPELPIIEPPRSWTKEEKERFASLPRETQEYLAQRETERDREFRQRQNEAAEQRKAIEAERSKVEQARQQYEFALSGTLQSLQESLTGEFSDINTMADVRRMQSDDPFRFNRWQVLQMEIAGRNEQMRQALHHREQERQQKMADFMQRETELLYDKIPELRDDEKRIKKSAEVISTLRDIGFTDPELNELASGQKDLSIHDHRVRMLFLDAHNYRQAQKQTKTVTAKPLPPVQKPGAAQGKDAAREAALTNLSKQLDSARGMNAARLAARLISERRRSAG